MPKKWASLANASMTDVPLPANGEVVGLVESPEAVGPRRDELFRQGSSFKPTQRSEIIGIDNILGEVEDMIHWLSHADQYARYSSRLQPGAIFAGDPGTGKTLVSRWIATASGARFINIRDFAHQDPLFTDVDIQDLFARSRRAYAATGQPIVLFWDEFENAAIERMDGMTTPEQRSVVSQLTAELDGIHGKNEGILLIGCTNYLSHIDAALLRRGRMGVQVTFHAPNRAGKEQILTHYLTQYATEAELDQHTLSFFFEKSATAADIEEACVEAWRFAVRRAIKGGTEPHLAQSDLVQVFLKQLLGPPMAFTLPDEDKLPIALHECGHAIAAMAYSVPLRLITIQPGRSSLGRILLDDPNEHIGAVADKLNNMRVSFAGVAAEKCAGLAPMTGSIDDLMRINQYADHLVNRLYVSDRVGFFDMTALNRESEYTTISPQVGPHMIDLIDTEVRQLIDRVWEQTWDTIRLVGSDHLHAIARALIERVTMTGGEFRELFIDVCGYEPETLHAPGDAHEL